ncbi:putative metal-dependent hydrolase related to alanyl-tRNA synthetase HxxxH domain protein [Thermus oshimai JL-2]|uniref:Putative metal-dependent hydrolase related to alanyl-tRNA synthetase HxxxH domain protein n=1 Tax=Thermus oshimai JL-2 TaxID=751945 RepID=K7R3K7_THEOS|nr:alanyl-tRNA editing protein [Thermus oshimai]AFV75494.1 putative metal-dependent hydrolase related to alanyl-tRNA synthetase HxxxH domain protein [Thermus oshimai JL-2]
MRLYLEDSYATRFQAKVQRAWSDAEGHRAVLSQTLFYPEAGGQPADHGVLRGEFGEVRVLHVYEEEKAFGDVVHVLSAPIPEGAEVEGEIDWKRRFRHMQRHTAQHILSQALLRAGGYRTVAVSLDGPVCTVDLGEEVEEERVREAEALANYAVYADYPVRAFYVGESELSRYPLRRPPKVRGQVRLVEIGDFDLAACGGTHLKTSAQAGPIKVLRWERYKGGTRVHFMAGWEALEDYHAKHALLQRLALSFSTQPLDLEKPLKKLQEELYALKGENLALKEALVEALLPRALEEKTLLVPAPVLGELAKRLLAWGDGTFLLLSPEGRFALLGPRREEVFQRLKALGAKGGGKEIYQGALPRERVMEALEEVRDGAL